MTGIMPVDEFKDALSKKALTRRDVARTLGAVGVASATMPLIQQPVMGEDGWLYLFTWNGYELPELHPAFTEKYGREPDSSFYADNDEALEKIRAGFEADVVCPSGSTVIRWIHAGLVEPIDTSRLSHWPDIFDQLRNIRGTIDDEGNQYYAPWSWGNSSIVFRSDLAPEYSGKENHTWKILWDPKYANRVAMRDNWAGTTIPAGLIAGVEDPFAMTDEEIVEVRKLLQEQRELNRFYWASEVDAQAALATGEIVAMYAWNSAYATLKAEGVEVEYMVPKEGLLTWVDGHVLLKSYVGTEEQRYDYLDATLAPEVGVFMIEEYAYGATNAKSYDMASQAIIENLGLEDPEAILSGSLWFQTVPPDIQRKLVNLHDEVLAGM